MVILFYILSHSINLSRNKHVFNKNLWHIFRDNINIERERGHRGEGGDGRRRGRGCSKMQKEETRGSEKETERNTCRKGSCHDDLRRISRAVAAASARAAQPQHKPPCRELPPPLRSPMRLVASRFSTYGARGAAPEGPTASLKRAVVPGHLPFAASELLPKSLSPKNPATDRAARGAG